MAEPEPEPEPIRLQTEIIEIEHEHEHEHGNGHGPIRMQREVNEALTQTFIPIFDGLTTPLDLPVHTKRASCNLRAILHSTQFLVVWGAFFAIPSLPITLAVMIVLPLVILVFLIVSFVALSLVQFLRHGSHYDKATQLKFVIRFWIYAVVIVLLLDVAWTYPIAKYVRNLKHVMVMELSIVSWLSLIAIICSLYLLDFILTSLLHLVPLLPVQHDESALVTKEAMFEIVDCLVFLLAEYTVLKRVTRFKNHKIHEVHTWKWVNVLIFVLIGYNIIRLCTHLGVFLFKILVDGKLDPSRIKHPQHKLLVEKMLPREYLVYYANGMKRNINLVWSSLLILLIWVFYFEPQVRNTPRADRIVRFGTRTCISLLICSFLWLLKKWAVLSWEASAMYIRLRSEILKSGKQLYFLGILGREIHDIFKLTYYTVEWFTSHPIEQIAMSPSTPPTITETRKGRGLLQLTLAIISFCFQSTSPDYFNRSNNDEEEEEEEGNVGERADNQRQVKKLMQKKRKIINRDLLMRNRTPTMHDIKQVAEYLISAKMALKQDTYVSSILARLTSYPDIDIREKLKQLIDKKSNRNGAPSVPNRLPRELTPLSENHIDNDWEYFEQEILQNQHCSEISIRTFLERSQNSCLFLANALSSTKEVVHCLNTIVSCLIIGATFILWLLLTGLATTKVLVLIASPLLAATFIFGDTCKTLFQGLMYVYVVHPILVGDLCSVDDKKMVVKAVGVWTTTFCKAENLGSLEEITYPNSALATKVVINHLTEFEWDDSVVINLGFPEKLVAKELKKRIETYLEGQDDFVPCSHSVVIEAEEDDLKMTIKIKYTITNTNIQDWSYHKCVRRKNKLQADVDDLVRQFKNHLAGPFG